MEEEKSLKLKKIIALVTLIVTAAILCITFYLLDKDFSRERTPVDAESNSPVNGAEPPSLPSSGEISYPKASVKNKFGLSAVQNLGGSASERAEKLLVCNDRIFAVGTTSSTDGDFAAGNENVFIAVLDSELNVLNCVTLKEESNVVFKDAVVGVDGITVLCTVRSGSVIHKLDAGLSAHKKTELPSFLNRLRNDENGNLYAFADGKSIAIIRFDSDLSIIAKQFAALPENGTILDFIPRAETALGLIAATPSETFLITSDSDKCDAKKLPVGKTDRFYTYERDGEDYYAFIGGSELKVLDSETNLYNRAEIGDAKYLVKSGNFLIGVSASSASSKWLCACGCSVLAEERLGLNVSALRATVALPYGNVSIAQSQSPQKPKTFSVLKFDGLKTDIYSYVSSAPSDLVVKGAANVGGKLVVMLETSASCAEFSSAKGAKDVFFLKLENPFD